MDSKKPARFMKAASRVRSVKLNKPPLRWLIDDLIRVAILFLYVSISRVANWIGPFGRFLEWFPEGELPQLSLKVSGQRRGVDGDCLLLHGLRIRCITTCQQS
jgi:hypothetical protein